MASEDQHILAQISQLAGQINRHKNGQVPIQHNQLAAVASASSYGGYPPNTAWRASHNGYSRGGRGSRPAQIHRNRSLVLTSNPITTTVSETTPKEESGNAITSGTAWVSKTDRHRQLINANIYEKDTQKRAKAIEETRQQKLKLKDNRERGRFLKYLQRGNIKNNVGASFDAGTAHGKHEVVVQGIRFMVVKNGSKLVKVPGEILKPHKQGRFDGHMMGLQHSGDINSAKCTPKVAVIGSVKFYRSKNGNMYRSGIIKAHRTTGGVKKVDELCKMFTTTGSCHNGPKCRYIHDPSKVAVCKEFLHKGSCPSGDSCDLSHELTPERTATCLHFARGNCSNANCRYTHVRVSPSALVCRAFGIYGYCEKGSTCMERHVYECPDFSNTGSCTNASCKLLHREKASVMRNKASHSSCESADDEISDVSSEGDEIGSDDVDSDDMEEFFDDEDRGFVDYIPLR